MINVSVGCEMLGIDSFSSANLSRSEKLLYQSLLGNKAIGIKRLIRGIRVAF